MMHHVLLVSDDLAWQGTARRALAREGYVVSSARDVKEALRAVVGRLPDLIIHEPRGDANELTLPQHVKGLAGGACVPMIGMIAKEEHPDLPAERGYTTLLAKAATVAVLVDTADALLKGRERDPVGHGRAIVLVDDNGLQRKLLRWTLSQWGFRVEEASSAKEALAMARRMPPVAIVSDFLMPGADGFQLCSVTKRDRALAHVPFIVVSSILVSDRQFEAAREFGADAFVSASPQHRALARALVGLLGAA